MRLAASREAELLAGKPLPKMYVAVDRQSHAVTWSSLKGRRNIVLNAIGSADLTSSYVFGFHLNFDPSMEPAVVEGDAVAIGDALLPEAYASVLKESTIHQKENAVARARARLADAGAPYPGASSNELMLELVKEEMAHARTLGQYEDRWVDHPVPNISEPAKKLCWLTDLAPSELFHGLSGGACGQC